MNVLDAISTRQSIRAFLPDPVPKQPIEQILQIAQRSPSGTNTQPWHVYASTGAVKQAITQDVRALVRSGRPLPSPGGALNYPLPASVPATGTPTTPLAIKASTSASESPSSSSSTRLCWPSRGAGARGISSRRSAL